MGISNDNDGEKFSLCWKFIPPNNSDAVTAILPTGIDRTKLKFITSNQTEISFNAAASGNTVQLTLPGGTAGSQYSLHAVYDDGIWKQVGRMDVISYPTNTMNLKIIPLGDPSANIEQAKLADSLNAIYNRYGINWTLTVDNGFNKSNSEGGKAEQIQEIIPNYQLTAGDKFFSEYSQQQNDLNALYKSYAENSNYNNETVYLFVLPTAPDGAGQATGDMPIGKQWGYLFGTAVDARTLAHELGHGKLELRHTFASEACGSGKQGQSNNLMDYPATGSSPLGGGQAVASDSLVYQQWSYIHKPAIIGKVFQDDAAGAWAGDAELFIEAIEQIRCDRFKGLNKRTFDFFHSISQENGELRFSTALLDDLKYGTFEVTGECINSSASEEINIQNIYKVDNVVYIGDPSTCRIKIKLSKTDDRQPNANDQAANLLSYLTISSNDYDSQQLKEYVEISQYSYENIIASLVKTNSCIFARMDANWRYYFLDKICKHTGTISIDESVCVYDLLSTIEDESDAENIMTRLTTDGNEKNLVKRIGSFETTQFTNIAYGLSHLFYSQNTTELIQKGETVDAENFFIWNPFGNERELYKNLVLDPSFASFFSWLYDTKLYSYKNFIENDGTFRINVAETSIPLQNYFYNIQIEPLELYSVHFASKNKFFPIDGKPVPMPGILIAWMIEQGDKAATQAIYDIGIFAASCAFPLGNLTKALQAKQKYAAIWNGLLLVKEMGDLLNSYENSRNQLAGLLKPGIANSFSDFSNNYDIIMLFIDLADHKFYTSSAELIDQWNGNSKKNKEELQKNYAEFYNQLDSMMINLQKEIEIKP